MTKYIECKFGWSQLKCYPRGEYWGIYYKSYGLIILGSFLENVGEIEDVPNSSRVYEMEEFFGHNILVHVPHAPEII
jgi:hypothetical protein